MQRVVRINLRLCGNIWPARDLCCPGLLPSIIIIGLALLANDRSFIGLPFTPLIDTQPFAADKVIVGSYRVSIWRFSVRYAGLPKGELGSGSPPLLGSLLIQVFMMYKLSRLNSGMISPVMVSSM